MSDARRGTERSACVGLLMWRMYVCTYVYTVRDTENLTFSADYRAVLSGSPRGQMADSVWTIGGFRADNWRIPHGTISRFRGIRVTKWRAGTQVSICSE